MKIVPIVLAAIALALAGMAAADPCAKCDPRAANWDPMVALAAFDENVTLDGWGTSWAGIIINGDGAVVNTFFAKGPYDFRYPQYTGYPSAASYQAWISQDDRSAIIFDSEGNVIDTMTTPTEELEKIIAAEYALH